jgi:hypothetical protein
MEDWQEMLIIILVVLITVTAYFVYLGTQIAGLQDSISTYGEMQGAISNAQGGSQDSGPATSPFDIILNGIGR